MDANERSFKMTQIEPISEEEKLRRGTEFMNLMFKEVEQEIIQEQPVADILENARNAILERNSRHGSSKVVHTLVANLWSQLLGKEITARQVMLMMILVKTARIQCGSLKTTEHTEDIAGYAQLLESLDETE
jgi:hypothetical protein